MDTTTGAAAGAARRTDASQIPVVDISPLRDNSDPVGVARQLHQASQTLGFIYVTGHGIPEAVIDAARSNAMDFFRLPDNAKDEIVVSGQHRGWLKQGQSKMHDNALPDLKESFIWGLEDDTGYTPKDHPLRGDNQWPTGVPGLRAAAREYFSHAHNVAHHLMRGFALGLDLDENFFLQTCSSPMSRASFVYYPPQRVENAGQQFGVGAHTDFGVLTVLGQDDVGGLQVEDINGDWIEAPPVPGSLVVNVGDLLSRWTAGEYKSTPHRVINASGRERLSLVLAFDPDPQTLIDPAAVLDQVPADAQPAITCGDYLVWRFGKAFSYRQSTDKT